MGTPKRRYQIFISSTFHGLIDERQALQSLILKLGHFPAGMELFPAGNETAWELIKEVISSSDYYILIIGGRYGSLDESGIGFTEKEYDYAQSLGKTVIPLLHKAPESLPRNHTETERHSWEKLKKFCKKVESQHHCTYWDSVIELCNNAVAGLNAAIADNSAAGWVIGDTVTNDRIYELLTNYVEEGIRRNLLARLLKLDSVNMLQENINIIFSHRDESKCPDRSQYWGGEISAPHNRQVKMTRSTSIPLTLEESSLIMQLWGTIYANTGLFKACHYCSCELTVPTKKIPVTKVLEEHLILIGSSKTNRITNAVFDKKIGTVYEFVECKKCNGVNVMGAKRNCYNTSPVLARVDDKSVYFCPHGGKKKGENGIDYALISRIKNPWNHNKYALVLAGCRAAGTLIIQFLLSNTEMLKYLVQLDDVFSVVVEVDYIRGIGLPEFKDNNGMVEVRVLDSANSNKVIAKTVNIDLSLINDHLNKLRITSNSPTPNKSKVLSK